MDAEAALLGSEIHDELFPLLFASSANVQRLICDLDDQVSDEHLQRLREVAKWLDDAMQAGRNLMSGVFPPDFQEHPWHKLARQKIEDLHLGSTVSIHWSIDEQVKRVNDAGQFNSAVAFAAMRIAVEACRNAIRHGRATTIDVHAGITGGAFVLSIEDDGIGFDPNLIPDGHYGLQAMKLRAREVGGELSVESVLGRGTKISFVSCPKT
jgi:signal transduction histidine kinase